MPTAFEGFKQSGNIIPVKDAVAQNGVIANTKLIKDTVGWSGKNILPNSINCTLFATNKNSSQEVGTIKENADGSITAVSITVGPIILRRHWKFNFKKPGRYVFSIGTNATINSWTLFFNDNPIDTGTVKEVCQIRQDQNKVEFEVTQEDINTYPYAFINQRFSVGETNTYYPMIYNADILDSTYESYCTNTAFSRNEQTILGSKNLLPVNNSSKTESGVTFTVNEDGTISITNNATATSTMDIPIPNMLNGKKLRLSGCPSDGGMNKYRFVVFINNTDSGYFDHGDGGYFTLPQNSTNNFVRLLIYTGYGDGLLFKPMITLSTDNESDYEHFVPYAMTNRELTEKIDYKAGDEVSLFDITCAGYITSSATEIYFTIPLPREIVGSSFTLASLNGVNEPSLTIRGIGGYVLTNKLLSELIVTTTIENKTFAIVKLKNTDNSAFNATNNTPLAVSLEHTKMVVS